GCGRSEDRAADGAGDDRHPAPRRRLEVPVVGCVDRPDRRGRRARVAYQLLVNDILRAVEVLRRGGLVAFPTETVYGLGADAANPAAVGRIFNVKGRPRNHPVIVHVAEATAIKFWAADVPPDAWAPAEAFWPGPLTLILPLGGLSVEALSDVLGHPVVVSAVAGGAAMGFVPVSVAADAATAEPVPAPGTLPSHYAPEARVEVVDADGVAGRAAALLGEG